MVSIKEAQVGEKREILRIAGRLREITTVHDKKGKVLHKIVSPLMVEFYARDMIQVIVGASILSIPVAFTEETWRLGETLPITNILLVMLLSITFISSFVYYNFYRNKLRKFFLNFLERVALIYLVSFAVVTVILSLIGAAHWSTEWLLAFRRSVLVALPASMSAAVTDMIK